MTRESKKNKTLQLGYSTNVHRGETLAQVYRFLEDYTLPIKQRVFGDQPTGLELRIGIGSAGELSTQKVRRQFADYLEESGLQLFSINAFPLLDFHSRRVKEQVYKPSWAESDRGRWTERIARIASDLVPEGVEVSISTLGGCFRRERHDARTFRKMAGVFLKCLETFVDLEADGHPMCLAVEPEPETTFESAQDVIDFVENYLLPQAFAAWKSRGSKARIETLVRRHFAVNIDTCHLSVLFLDQVRSLRQLEKAGIRLGKLHVTNAVTLKNPFRSPSAYEDLRAMNEPRYFHQFCAVDKAGKICWRELDLNLLPRKLIRGKHPDATEIRSHFHVPLYMKRYHRLHTTQDETAVAVREVIRSKATNHIVLETYTWPIIAGRVRQKEKLIDGIAREYRWLLGVLGE